MAQRHHSPFALKPDQRATLGVTAVMRTLLDRPLRETKWWFDLRNLTNVGGLLRPAIE
jgi:hypothetical protein